MRSTLFLKTICVLLAVPSLSAFAASFVVGVLVPGQPGSLEAASRQRLETKLTAALSSAGVSAATFETRFVVFAGLDVRREETAEAGLTRIITVSIDTTFHLQDSKTKAVFSSFTQASSGGGFNRGEAIASALEKLDLSGPGFREFLRTGESKVVAFYKQNCGSILADATAHASMGRREEAFAILLGVPDVSECSSRARAQVGRILDEHRRAQCEKATSMARADLARGDYVSAVRKVGSIGPSLGSCFMKAQEIVSIAETRITEKEIREWQEARRRFDENAQFSREVLRKEAALEEKRIDAARAIAEAYYSSRPAVEVNAIIVR